MLLEKIIGKGNTAEVYEFGKKDVIKLFYDTIPLEWVKREFENSKLINELGIPAPTTKSMEKINDRIGIVYERIVGKNFTQMLSSKPLLVLKHASNFAKLQALYHTKIADNLPSQKEYLSKNITYTNLLNLEEKKIILEKLRDLPDDNKICHGDYHSDNITFQNGEAKILDWMTCTSGNPAGDVARTLIIMKFSFLPQDMPKATKILIQLVRNVFVRAYLNSYIKLANISKVNIAEWLLPVMAARLTEGIPDGEKQFLLNRIRDSLLKN
ncbi:phosphotransferase family protein [Lederbergia citri]|uniref:Phosphotransferase n=1 Tax=Lederbergia citri TaxID=2833580 RepID=A0A942TDQ7_9BACI|nr:aminoglycoside phosphotransferase family protein [Lederbergia citri]MBS4196076.1 phosphotransferase [Lederbergia citri]